MSIVVTIPAEWLHNEGYDLLIMRRLQEAGIPVTRMDHMTPRIDSGELTDRMVPEGIEFTYTAPIVPPDPRDREIAELKSKVEQAEKALEGGDA